MTDNKIINIEDIKRGDVVRIVREVTVRSVHMADDLVQAHVTTPDGGVHILDDATVELVERPTAIPTRPGSVISIVISAVTNQADRSVWLLSNSGSWVSSGGAKLTARDMETVLATHYVKHEVVYDAAKWPIRDQEEED